MLTLDPQKDAAAAGLAPLAAALCAAARQRGAALPLDDVAAALARPFLVCALSHDSDVARWPAYAQDAFLIPAARLFGVTVREIHPPEAARGLERAQEFEQHFEHSYRPLVWRALEHDQPVLAWQGWAGDDPLAWGVITRTCEQGTGLAGTVLGASLRTAVLERPAVQMYVLERVEPSSPGSTELFATVVEHARVALHNRFAERFAAVTGTAALDTIVAQVDAGTGAFGESTTGSDVRRWAQWLAAGCASGLRFCARHKAAGQCAAAAIEHMLREMDGAVRPLCGGTPDRSTVAASLRALRSAMTAAAL